MKMKWALMCGALLAAGCGGDDPITIEEIAEEPDSKDIAMLCDLYIQRLRTEPDKQGEFGMQQMVRAGISEKTMEKVRKERKKGREAYFDGAEECCKTLKKDVKDLNDMQTAYVYADMMLSGITTNMLTPAQQRQGRALRDRAADNMTRPESNVAYDVRTSLPQCTKRAGAETTKTTTAAIGKILEKEKK